MDKQLEKDILGMIEDPDHSQEGFVALLQYIKTLEKRISFLESQSITGRRVAGPIRG